VQDRGGAGLEALQAATYQLIEAANHQSRSARPADLISRHRATIESGCGPDQSQIYAGAAERRFDTLQIYLGSLYVNDFNLFGRTYQVTAQADAPFRREPKDIVGLKTRNASGEMVPLGPGGGA